MNALTICGTAQFPEVVLNPQAGSLLIRGNSLPKDAVSSFTSVYKWINDYLENPQSRTVITFQMSYFNSSTVKAFCLILKKLEAFYQSKAGDVKVVWLSPSDDPDMKEAGMDMADRFDLPFEFGVFQEQELEH